MRQRVRPLLLCGMKGKGLVTSAVWTVVWGGRPGKWALTVSAAEGVIAALRFSFPLVSALP